MKRGLLLASIFSVALLSGCSNSLFSSGSSSALQGLLANSGSALTSGSINNVAGIMGYCVKNKIMNDSGLNSLKDKLTNALGGQAQQTTDYKDGLLGILNAKDGKSVDLSQLTSSPLVEQIKQKACDLAMSQAKAFL